MLQMRGSFRARQEVQGMCISQRQPGNPGSGQPHHRPGSESAIKGDMVRDEFDINQHRANRVPTLNNLWNMYLPWAKEHKKSWRTDKCYYGKHLESRFGNKPLDSITPFDIEKMKLELKKGLNMHGKPFSAQTIKHQIVILRRLYNLARKWGIYDGKSPTAAVQMPKVDNKRTEFLTDEQAESLLDTLEKWPCKNSAAFVKFAMYTGFRRGEMFKLTWEDVDFHRGMIRLRDPKGGKSQTVPVSNEALDVLRHIETSSQFVFPGLGGNQRIDFKGPWLKIRKAAGLPDDFRLHGLRHHFASALVSSGVDLAVVKELLTHKDMATTQRYAHLRTDAVKRAALKSGELLKPKQKSGRVMKEAK